MTAAPQGRPKPEFSCSECAAQYLLPFQASHAAWCTQAPTHTDPLRYEHAIRFRKVANRYPRRVAEAYGWDLARAASDADEVVAARVAEWEASQGLKPINWPAVGMREGQMAIDVDA